jgi:hypothetical protein
MGAKHSITPSVHSRLVQELEEANLQFDEVARAHRQIVTDIPSDLPQPDGAQRIHSVSQQLASARENIARAHSRLSDFLDSGIIPEDLK